MFNSLLGKLMPVSPNSDSEPASPALTSSSSSVAEVLLSIERSRKRHLSPGVLRGDKVADLLIEQEASASPSLKKPRPNLGESPPADNMAMSMADFENYMKRNVESKLTALESGLGDLKTTVGKVDRAIKQNTKKIDKHQDLIRANAESILEMRCEMKRISERPVPAAPSSRAESCPILPGSSQDPCRPVEDDDFFIARRSLRLWPISGTNTQELGRSTLAFIRETLELGDTMESSIEHVSRPRFPSGTQVRQEVLVRTCRPL